MRPSRASNDEVASMVQKQPQKTSSFRPPDHRDLDFNDDDDLGPAPPHDDQLQDEPMMAGEASPTPPRGLIQTWPKQQIIPADARSVAGVDGSGCSSSAAQLDVVAVAGPSASEEDPAQPDSTFDGPSASSVSPAGDVTEPSCSGLPGPGAVVNGFRPLDGTDRDRRLSELEKQFEIGKEVDF